MTSQPGSHTDFLFIVCVWKDLLASHILCMLISMFRHRKTHLQGYVCFLFNQKKNLKLDTETLQIVLGWDFLQLSSLKLEAFLKSLQ